jgi:hydroxymethylpyrimidine/phosphomethylpyrimidine kinase
MKKVLTAAGSDCSGGAGIQADLKTFAAHGVYGMSVITALTAQNTLGVTAVHDVPSVFIGEQLDSVFTDIPPDAVKIGMVSNAENARIIAKQLKRYNAKNIVIDPVMISTSGSSLLEDSAVAVLTEQLFPLAVLVTPNIPEAEKLADMNIASAEDMITAAMKIAGTTGGGVLVKGGHSRANADDLLYTNGETVWLKGERIDNPNTHGTGCTLSSAIACGLAGGESLTDSVRTAKAYINAALRVGFDVGHGNGPLWHGV